jgi:hypothetical protein
VRNVTIAERSWKSKDQGGTSSESAKRAAAADPIEASFLSYSSYTFTEG